MMLLAARAYTARGTTWRQWRHQLWGTGARAPWICMQVYKLDAPSYAYKLPDYNWACTTPGRIYHPQKERLLEAPHFLTARTVEVIYILYRYIHCVSKMSTFYFVNNVVKSHPILIIFGTRYPHEIRHIRVINLPTSPVYCKTTPSKSLSLCKPRCEKQRSLTLETRVLQEHGSPATHFFSPSDLYPNRATESICKLMLAKSPESAHKN